MKHKRLHFASLSTGKKHHVWGARWVLSDAPSPWAAQAQPLQRGEGSSTPWTEHEQTAGLRLQAPCAASASLRSLYWSARGIPRISRGGESPSLPFTGTRQKRPGATTQTRSGGTQSQQRERGLSIGEALSSCSKVPSGPVRQSRAQKERLEGQDKKV